MARTLTISNGTITANLLNTNTTWGLDFNGYTQQDPPLNQIRRENIYGEGIGLIHSVAGSVIQTYEVDLSATSHDNAAAIIQALMTLAESARQFHTTRWQKTTVYLTEQTNTETNARYALVYDIRLKLNQQLYGVIFDRENYVESATITVEREPYWRSAIPLSALPAALTIGAPQAPGTQADATMQYICNYRDENALTHIYNEDNSAGTFSANLIASSSFSYFPASPALNDAVYFGSTDGFFRHVILNIGVVGVFNWAITWEWWNGSAWVSDSAGVVSNTLVFTSSGSTGTTVIVVHTPTAWVTTAINGVTAHWIRARISTFTSWTSSPTQTGQVVYNPRDSYISIAADQINGDVEALAMLRYFMKINTVANLDFLAIGIKSRGLTTFLSRFNFGVDNPAAWSVTNGTDTTTVADIQAPGGSRASCTFSGNTAMAQRVRVGTTTNANIKDMEGEYYAYLRCQQIGGSVGDVSVKLRVNYFSGIDTAVVSLKAVGQGIEMLSLGPVSILSSRIITASDTSYLDLRLEIHASALSATPDLYIYDLVLIPIDEIAMVASNTVGDSISDRNQGLDIDGGLLRFGPVRKGPNSEVPDAIVNSWEQRGDLLRFPHDKAFNIYFLMANYISGVHYAFEYFAGSFMAYALERWVFMRGNE